MATIVRAAILIVVTGLAGSPVFADILQLPGGGYGVTQAEKSVPRGASEDDVLKMLGEPRRRNEPVGTPAISSWEYDQFRVYFESGLVLHTVVAAP